MTGMMVLFHCESNPGYAASSHEHTFLEVAKYFTTDMADIHFAYTTLDGGITPSLPEDLKNIIQLDTRWSTPQQLRAAERYIKDHNITRLLGFDQAVSRPMYKVFRKSGVKTFVSYWGAPMSSLNTGLKLIVKRLEVATKRHGPDHYVFQSTGMRDTAVDGRGIPLSKTSIVKTGIDTTKYAPDDTKKYYAHEQLDIPRDREIVVFTGHMERRKGVHVILQAAKVLTQDIGYKNVQFLILGNRPGEKEHFEEYLRDPNVTEHITFGGYRNDVPDILKSCALGMIASTEWDSFPMSSLEMAATGLPIMVSALPGLDEAVTPETGRTFPVGNYNIAAQTLQDMLSNQKMRMAMGKASRERVIQHYSRASQAMGLIDIFEALENTTEHAL